MNKPLPSFLLNEDFSKMLPSAPICCVDSNAALGVFTSGLDFFNALTEYDHLDVVTYTCNGAQHNRLNLRRLIVGTNSSIGHTTCKDVRPTLGYKCFANVHTKLYIGWVGRKATAYVGSHNYTTPRNEELMIRADKKQTILLVQYFDNLWRSKHAPIIKH